MLEIPEALTIAKQINNTIIGRRIVSVEANKSPHKFAWYYKDPADYNQRLAGKAITKAEAYGGYISVRAENAVLLLGEGVALRYHDKSQKRPVKHQLLMELDDQSAVSASIQMYGGIWCFEEQEDFDNYYYKIALQKPSPLSEDFDLDYFNKLTMPLEMQKLSVKAFLATDQRIPGLGNGVLQDILWIAGLHPKRKMNTLSGEDIKKLFHGIRSVLTEMAQAGGRDTEKDFFGSKGGYLTKMSKNSANTLCNACGSHIVKENYMGGSIYYCKGCQPHKK